LPADDEFLAENCPWLSLAKDLIRKEWVLDLRLEDMSGAKEDLDSLLHQASEQENEYNWLGAAEIFAKAANAIPEAQVQRTCDVLERKAFALYKAALQAENVDGFKRSAEKATKAYDEVKSLCLEVDAPQYGARAYRCDAMIDFMRFLRASDADERRETTSESWNHAKESLNVFESLGDMHEFCRTFYDSSLAAIYYSNLVPDYETRKRVWMEATSCGEKAVEHVRNHEDDDTKVKILVLVACFLTRASYAHLCDEPPERCQKRAKDLWREAESISREKVLTSLPYGYITGDAPVDPDRQSIKELPEYRRAFTLVRDSRDRIITGHALAGISFYAHWLGMDHPDKETGDALFAESLETALKARDEFLKIGFVAETGHNIWIMSPYADFYNLKGFIERDLDKKREFVEKGLGALPEYARLARASGYSWMNGCSEHIHGMLKYLLATTQTNMAEKRASLQEATEHLRKGMDILSRWDSETTYNFGVWSYPLACAQAELAAATTDPESAARILREAISMQERSHKMLEEGAKAMDVWQDSANLAMLGDSQREIGRRYCALFELDRNHKHLKNALKCFEESHGFYRRSGISPNRAAESNWEAARIHDQLNDHVKAAEMFLSASKEFLVAGEKMPRLKTLFSEQATYLEAWSEFEKAKLHHASQEYQQAQSYFERAADLHDTLDKWRFLASNYRAWAQIDNAEAQSREDNRAEASKSFEEAAALFEESRTELDDSGMKVENNDEKRMIQRLLNASDPRRKYCLVRAMIEKARQLDVEGMSSSSSDMFRTAADELERLAGEATTEQDRRDITLLGIVSRAWQKMNQAEAEVTSEPYAEAAVLFEEAKEYSTNEKAKALAVGHSRFCKALEAGTRFVDTRESTLHVTAVRNLESASAYYAKAGADSCSEYARASKLLFDAYAYLSRASEEQDQAKAAKTYAKAEKILRVSSESYRKAGQPGKREQVLKLLDRAKGEKELAVSLMDVFEAPSGAPPTAAFGTPMPSHEEAVGLDRFAHADVQATLIVQKRNIGIGDNLSVEIELVNAGRASALLTKVENLIPKGFEVQSKPAACRIENSYITMKGRRLDPLKTEEIALVLKPMIQGTFEFRPRILYIDDVGSYRAREVEACEVTVREMGLSGWLKGPEKRS
jgi:hypothetical protein